MKPFAIPLAPKCDATTAGSLRLVTQTNAAAATAMRNGTVALLDLYRAPDPGGSTVEFERHSADHTPRSTPAPPLSKRPPRWRSLSLTVTRAASCRSDVRLRHRPWHPHAETGPRHRNVPP